MKKNQVVYGSIVEINQKIKISQTLIHKFKSRLTSNTGNAGTGRVSGRFFCRLLGPIIKIGLPLMKNVLKPLTKSISIPLGLTVALSVVNSGIHKNVLLSRTATLIISNEEYEPKNVYQLYNFLLLQKTKRSSVQYLAHYNQHPLFG